MAAKKLSAPSGWLPIPDDTPSVPGAPSAPRTGLSGAALSGSSRPLRKDEKKKSEFVKQQEALKPVANQDRNSAGAPAREAKAIGNMMLLSIPGAVTFVGGMGTDIIKGSLVTLFKGRGAYKGKTTDEFVNSLHNTVSLVYDNRGRGVFEGEWGGRFKEYARMYKAGQAITPLITEDLGNITLLSGMLGKGLKMGGAAAGAREAAVVGTAEAGAAEAAAQAARQSRAYRVGERLSQVSHAADEAMGKMLFAPYRTAVKGASFTNKVTGKTYTIGGLGSLYRNGAYLGEGYRAWGRRGAEGLQRQLDAYRAEHPDIPLHELNNDPYVVKMHKDIARANRQAQSWEEKQYVKAAGRRAAGEQGSVNREVMAEKTNPLYKEEMGELTQTEQSVVIATMNGRAQLVKVMSRLGYTPEQIAQISRYNSNPEFHLTPEAAALAVKFIDGDPSVDYRTYERIGRAVENVSRNIGSVTTAAMEGYGRRYKLSDEYIVPTPMVESLRARLKRANLKPLLDIMDALEEQGLFDLEVTDPRRLDALAAIVEMLPDDIALDSSIYPANMRENIEFYKRFRRYLNRQAIAAGTGEFPKTPRSGKEKSAETYINQAKRAVAKIEERLQEIAEQVSRAEEKHSKNQNMLRTYDMAEEFVNGASIETLAKKYDLPPELVAKLLARNKMVRAWRAMASSKADYERIRRQARKLGVGAETAAIREQLVLEEQAALAAAEEASAAYEATLADFKLEQEEIAAEGKALLEELDVAEDNLADAEDDYVAAGGDLEDLMMDDDPVSRLEADTAGGRNDVYAQLSDYGTISVKNVTTPGSLDAIAEALGESVPDNPTAVSNIGDLSTSHAALRQIVRWAQEVANAKNEKARIELILNPPDYVSPELAKKMLAGMSRKDIAKIDKSKPNHPLTKFGKKFYEYSTELAKAISHIQHYVDTYGEVDFVDWSQEPYARNTRSSYGLDNRQHYTIALPSVPREGVSPTLYFSSETPRQVLLDLVGALEKAIQEDAGAVGVYAGDFEPRLKGGPYVHFDGLTKKLSKYKDAALKDLAEIRKKIEKAKAADPSVAVTDADMIPGVEPAPVRPVEPSRLQPPKRLASVDEPAPPAASAVDPTDVEFFAQKMVEDPEMFDEIKALVEERRYLEKAVDELRNPTKEDLRQHRKDRLADLDMQIQYLYGYAASVLGGPLDLATGKPQFSMSPIPGDSMWEWWYRQSPKTRQRWAREYFNNTKVRTSSYVDQAGNVHEFKIPDPTVKGGTLEDTITLSNDDSISPDEWGEQFIEWENSVHKLRQERARLKKYAVTAEEYLQDSSELVQAQDALDKIIGEDGVDDTTVQAHDRAVEMMAKRIAGEKPQSPSQVVPDETITNPVVREAVYTQAMVDSLAAEAAVKMDLARSATDRINALDSFLAAAERNKQGKAEFLKAVEAQNKRYNQALIDQPARLVKLRERERELKNTRRKLKTVIGRIERSPEFGMLQNAPANLPLTAAMDSSLSYPGELIAVENADGNVLTPRGPLYVPTGGRREFAGGLRTSLEREGLEGHTKATSEYWRDGDRETIFGLRELAYRLSGDQKKFVKNDYWRSLIASFGQTVMQTVGADGKTRGIFTPEELVAFRERAQQIAVNYPDYELYDFLGETPPTGMDDFVPGIGADAPGVPSPRRNVDIATRRAFGKILKDEMQFRGYEVVDPWGAIDKTISLENITENSYFLPQGMKERVATVRLALTPSEWNAALRGLNKINSFFKKSVLALSVTWQLGDLISNTIISTLSGVNLNDLGRQMMEVYRNEYGSTRALWDPRVEGTVTQKGQMLRESATQDTSLRIEELRQQRGLPALEEKPPRGGRLGAGINRVVGVSFKVNETINRLGRHAYYLELLETELKKLGKDIDTVADDGSWRSDKMIRELWFKTAETANKYLGDFADLSPFERQYVTLGVPFYAWIKHIHKVLHALMIEHPDRLKWYVYLGTLGADVENDPLDLRLGTLPVFGGAASTNFLNPLADFAEGPLASLMFEGDARPLLRTSGPVPRIAAGLLGIDLPRATMINKPSERVTYSRTGTAQPSLLVPTDPKTYGQTAGFMLQQFPIFSRIANLLPTSDNPIMATGPTARYATGEARTNPISGDRVSQPGGRLAALGRLLSLPFIPSRSDEQIEDVYQSARARLKTVRRLQGGKSIGTP